MTGRIQLISLVSFAALAPAVCFHPAASTGAEPESGRGFRKRRAGDPAYQTVLEWINGARIPVTRKE